MDSNDIEHLDPHSVCAWYCFVLNMENGLRTNHQMDKKSLIHPNINMNVSGLSFTQWWVVCCCWIERNHILFYYEQNHQHVLRWNMRIWELSKTLIISNNAVNNPDVIHQLNNTSALPNLILVGIWHKHQRKELQLFATKVAVVASN